MIDDIVDDGLSDEEIGALTLAWIEELRSKPSVRLPDTAATALRLVRDDEL